MPATPAQLRAIVDGFDWASYHKGLASDLGDGVYTIVHTQGARGASRAGGTWNPDDPFVTESLTGYVGERIVDLDETSKNDVSTLIRGVLDAGESLTSTELGDKIADEVQTKFEGYADWRADRIARSETAIAYNFGNVFGYRQAGVEEVEVSDGDDDEECAAVNGQVWTLDQALAEPIAHPNCTRDFSPILLDDSASDEKGDALSRVFARMRALVGYLPPTVHLRVVT